MVDVFEAVGDGDEVRLHQIAVVAEGEASAGHTVCDLSLTKTMSNVPEYATIGDCPKCFPAQLERVHHAARAGTSS
jgi:hypothetical protein